MDEVNGKRTEWWLLATPSPRITPKSSFLRKLEKQQNPTPPEPPRGDNVTPLSRGKRSQGSL